MLRIRLRRVGKKKKPMYRIVVADSRAPRDGAFVENLGYYHPLDNPTTIVIDEERAKHWLDKGAIPSDRVSKILKIQGIAEIPAKLATRIALGEARAKGAKAEAKASEAEASASAEEPKAEAKASEAEASASAEEPKAEVAKETATEEPKAEAAKETATEEPKAEAAKETATEQPKAEAAKETATEEPKAEAAKEDAAGEGEKRSE